MPLHDWTQVPAGIFHHFHNAWIAQLSDCLNDGLLPQDIYALGEQRSGDIGPDVLALRSPNDEEPEFPAAKPFEPDPDCGGTPVALAEAPPQVALTQDAPEDMFFCLAKQRSIVIRHVSGDRIVAMVEIVSLANKHARGTLYDFTDKVIAALRDGIHVMVIDPFPPGKHDPYGIHGAIWDELNAGSYEPPSDKQQTLVSYAARRPVKAFVDPIGVGSVLTEMPLFLTTETYIPVPLETTYARAWAGVPQRWKRVFEA